LGTLIRGLPPIQCHVRLPKSRALRHCPCAPTVPRGAARHSPYWILRALNCRLAATYHFAPPRVTVLEVQRPLYQRAFDSIAAKASIQHSEEQEAWPTPGAGREAAISHCHRLWHFAPNVSPVFSNSHVVDSTASIFFPSCT
jgi:hypothetical protein